MKSFTKTPGGVTHLVVHLTHEPEVPGSIAGTATYFCFSFHHSTESRRAAVSYWRKNVYLVPLRSSVVRLTDRPVMEVRQQNRKTGPDSTQLSMKLFLFINVEMPTIVGILTFMSGKNDILGLSEPKQSRIS